MEAGDIRMLTEVHHIMVLMEAGDIKMPTEAVPIMEKTEVGGIKTKMEVAHIMRVTTVALTMIRTMTMRGMFQMGSDLQLVWLV